MDFKEIYKIAKDHINTIVDDSQDIRLEQASHNDKLGTWEVVISYLTEDKNKPRGGGSLPMFIAERPFERIYKKLDISDKGELKGFYIYDKA